MGVTTFAVGANGDPGRVIEEGRAGSSLGNDPGLMSMKVSQGRKGTAVGIVGMVAELPLSD